MDFSLYHFATWLLDLIYWDGELLGEENLPRQGPAIFVGNHLGPDGPIGAICTIPRRCFSWVVAENVDPALAPEYLRWDFVERSLKLHPPTSLKVATAIAKVSVPLLRTLGCIPVYKGDTDGLLKTLQLSLELLLANKFLLIFPEDNTLPEDPLTGMKPFKKTFTRLGEMLYQANGKVLDFYPVAIHGSHKVWVGKPVSFQPMNPLVRERMRLKDRLEEEIRDMYLEMEGGTQLGAGEKTSPQHSHVG
jgi:1-acyl-sn-glycerol-3-phosphate acyltransferase